MLARILLVFALLAGCSSDQGGETPLRLVVMSFNTYGAGSNNGKTVNETVAVIRAVDPDIVALLEVRAESDPCTAVCPATGPSRAPDIASELGYFLYQQEQQNEALWANAILSRYPVVSSTGNDLGVVLDVLGRRVAMFGIHLSDFPYQPYQLLGIPYSGAVFLQTEADAIAAANAARGAGMALLLAELESVAGVDAVIVAGDFNEPSHRDWTERAAAIGRHPLSVKFPTTRRLESIGFVDTYRAAYPDEIEHPGYTWTPSSAADDKSEHHDRIDYLFMRAAGGVVESAAVVGEQRPDADIVVTPWPSDHRAVVATVSIP